MAYLAIKGHATRGNEVIALLEMLGGVNSANYSGKESDRGYYIEIDRGICFIDSIVENLDFREVSLEQFFERFPYKVGDKVKNMYGVYGKVYAMKWIDDEIQYRLDFGHHTSGWYGADELQPFEEKEPMEEKKINQMSLANCDLDEIEIVLGDKFELKIKDGKYYAVRKKPQYPTTYKECCDVLGLDTMDNDAQGYKADSIIRFQELLIARNAYRKMAGDCAIEWQNVRQPKFCIWFEYGKICRGGALRNQHFLAFPTAEMRNAFYENFKDLIEQCKELL